MLAIQRSQRGPVKSASGHQLRVLEYIPHRKRRLPYMIVKEKNNKKTEKQKTKQRNTDKTMSAY